VKISWFDEAWQDYIYWQVQDKKTIKRINNLIKDIKRNGYIGIGKPEPLKVNSAGFGAGELMKSTVWCIGSRMASLKFCPVKDIMMISK